MRYAAILPLVCLAGCAEVGDVAGRVRTGLSGLGLSLGNDMRAEAAAPVANPAAEVPVDAPAGAPVAALPDNAPVAAVPKAANGRLGTTVAGLGDPGKPGLWLQTPLVSAGGKGRVVWPSSGRWVAVALEPADGAVTSGSLMSLAAFQALGAPLTELIEVEVYAGG
ncbi:hypothetical protein [Pseudodonghicola flavimaris]|uniref:D-galactarate dehydratase n=1 Tax=Pseudodonghicola flavimaris TaxID=3050036 RepID=A0ABT7EV03_9RHOB|nr:hypothetical protein [Pseudodonghicola flavimaris]MDK3016172.1 hypothetical protein [Pseudodonghicola flavimaris]